MRTALTLGWLLEAAEGTLINLEDKARVDLSFFRRLEIERLPLDDEALAAAEALVALSILRRDKTKFTLNRNALLTKVDYCRGVRDTLSVVGSMAPEPVRLCAAIPDGLEEIVEVALRKNTVDMRSNLLDIISGAQSWVALVSPFWDVETVNELADVLIRRMEAGVYVHIMSRFDQKKRERGDDRLKAKLARFDKCTLYAWYEESSVDRLKHQSFHYKAIVSDDNKAYLGTANMTVGSLRSRMELGVILEGDLARRLSQIVKVTLSIARPLPPPVRSTGH